MNQTLIHVDLDVDDTQYHGSALNKDTGEIIGQHRLFSTIDEPDIWARTLDDQIALCIDIGEPAVERIKKSSRLAHAVKIYYFNSKSDVWWAQAKNKVKQLKVSVYRFQWQDIQALASVVERTMEISVTINGDSAYVATALGEHEVSWEALQES